MYQWGTSTAPVPSGWSGVPANAGNDVTVNVPANNTAGHVLWTRLRVEHVHPSTNTTNTYGYTPACRQGEYYRP